ncbi:MAG: hypothetical protein AB7L66_06455 [Gemmatimonadales bacterium]
MPTIWNDQERAALCGRAGQLTPESTARWGSMTVTGMLAHVNDAARMASGDLPVSGRAPTFLKWPPVRYLMIYVVPMPKGAPTAPALLARGTEAAFAAEQRDFATLLDDLARRTRLAPTHPAFGSMTHRDWGALIHKHVDHHLRQFGV